MDGTPGLTQVLEHFAKKKSAVTMYIPSVQFSRTIHSFTTLPFPTKLAHIGTWSKARDEFDMCAVLRAIFRWHSHSLSQRADGLFGAFVVHDIVGTSHSLTDVEHSKEDLRIREARPFLSQRLLLVGDWYHRNSTAMLSWYRSKRSYGYVRCDMNPSFSLTSF